MKASYYYLQSAGHAGSSIHRERAEALFRQLSAITGADFSPVSRSALSQQPVSIVYVATGGTAGLFRECTPALKDPVYLVSIGSDNSLSASMEMLSYLHQQGRSGEILHGDADAIAPRLALALKAAQARESMDGMRIGMVGAPSDWLISAGTDYSRLHRLLGVTVLDIPMEEFFAEIQAGGYPACEQTAALLDSGFDRGEVEKALDIYGALSRLVDHYNLQALSVRCFDLLSTVRNTSCLGLALLNSRGIFAGCEGDLPSLLSMILLGKLTGQPVFQCNPSRIDLQANRIVFAHCTLPLNMPCRYRLDTHFESGLGVAVDGTIPSGDATVFKVSGDFRRYFATDAHILEDLHEADLCRTQIRIQCGEPGVETFLKAPIGNHYLVAQGHHAASLHEFFRLLGCGEAVV